MSLSSSHHQLRPPRRLVEMLAANQSYSCDTLPPARIADPSSSSPSRSPSPHPSGSTTFDIPAVTTEEEPEEEEVRERWEASVQEQEQEASTSTSQPPLQPSQGRKLCIRHQRMADEGMNLQLQKVCFVFVCLYLDSAVVCCFGFSRNRRPHAPAFLSRSSHLVMQAAKDAAP